jgi:hypothetical protein
MSSLQPLYKFLARGRLGPLSGFAWPSPDVGGAAWVEVQGPLELCVRGLHVCRGVDLAHWLHEELWQLETTGEQQAGIDCLIVRRARLVRRIDAWSDGGAARFAEACTQRARRLTAPATDAAVQGFVADSQEAAQEGDVAGSAYVAALAIMKSSERDEQERVFRRERLWQSEWIVSEVLGF